MGRGRVASHLHLPLRACGSVPRPARAPSPNKRRKHPGMAENCLALEECRLVAIQRREMVRLAISPSKSNSQLEERNQDDTEHKPVGDKGRHANTTNQSQ